MPARSPAWKLLDEKSFDSESEFRITRNFGERRFAEM